MNCHIMGYNLRKRGLQSKTMFLKNKNKKELGYKTDLRMIYIKFFN